MEIIQSLSTNITPQLAASTEGRSYPWRSFPPRLQFLFGNIAANCSAPIEMIAAAVVSAIATANQDLANVQAPHGATEPLSLALIVIAESSERKTLVDKLVFASFREFEAESGRLNLESATNFETDLLVWVERLKVLKREIRESLADPNDAIDKALREKLASHLESKPTRSVAPQFLLSDVTCAALLWHLHTSSPSAALISDEGSTILGGGATSNLSVLCSLWSGSEVNVLRKSTDSFRLRDARLTIAPSIQPSEFKKFNHKKGDSARGVGLFPRCLPAWPQSTQGYRADLPYCPDQSQLKAFHARIRELLNLGKERRSGQTHTRDLLQFSAESVEFLHRFGQEIEFEIRPNGRLAKSRDAASKTPEQARRLAGNLHYFEGRSGPIAIDLTRNACIIAMWYLEEFRRIFDKPAPIPQEEIDAMEIDAGLLQMFYQSNNPYFNRSDLLIGFTNLKKSTTRLNKALSLLEHHGWLRQHFDRRNGIKIVTLNPSVYPRAAVGAIYPLRNFSYQFMN